MTPEQWLRIIDDAVAASHARAGAWITCHAGCAECCYACFPITMLDAERLREGLARLDPERAGAITARARHYRDRVRDSFPGDWSSGRLTAEESWREWFFARQKGVPCPALDTDSGRCELYEHRPVACRIYGHLIQIGAEPQQPCRLCFAGVSPRQMEACRLVVPEPAAEAGEHTIVAMALA